MKYLTVILIVTIIEQYDTKQENIIWTALGLYKLELLLT